MRAALQVFTFKEGLLARLAHDLRLTVRDWDATLQAGELTATARLDSLTVDGVAQRVDHLGQTRLDTDTLTTADKRKIEDTLAREVLSVAVHPNARYVARARAVDARCVVLAGSLTLAGVARACRIELRSVAGADTGGEWTGEVTLIPSQFGIAPYKALGGALRVADRVVVRIAVWLGDTSASTLLATTETLRFAPQRDV